MTIAPIETCYAGHRFRSRLEARWAVFFDHIGIPWQYEPQGYVIDERPYLPDFLLTDCGTWVEVKGNPLDLDVRLMERAALNLPDMPAVQTHGPKLLVLGPIPARPSGGDWAWTGLWVSQDLDGEMIAQGDWFSFSEYHKNRRPWYCGNTSMADRFTCGDPPSDWLVPVIDMGEPGVPEAYAAARYARFEHGEQG